MIDFVSSHIRNYQEYIPGEQSSERVIKLNANENHLSPHPRIREFLKNFSINRLRYYPDPHYQDLDSVVRKSYRLKKDVGLVFGNGADEIIRGVFKTFFHPHRDSVLLTELTYPGYKTYADLEGVGVEYLPINPDFSISFKELGKTKSRVFFLTNPNNPTGIAVPTKEILAAAKLHPDKLFVVDEAYAAFSKDTCLRFLPQPNLIVLKTLSKSFSACGLRLGFGAGTLDHAHCIRKVLDPYNLSLLTIEIGKIILSDLEYMERQVDQVNLIREWFVGEILKQGFQVIPSQANFLLLKPPQRNGRTGTARDLFQFMKKNGIFIRYFEKPKISDYIRITIGSKRDLREVLSVIRRFYSC